MVSPSTISLICGVVGLVLVALSSTPAVWRIYKRFSRQEKGEGESEDADNGESTHQFYEDEDGIANEETEKDFSDKIQKSVIVVSSVAGVLISFVLALLATLRPDLSLWPDQWVQLGIWILLVLQGTALFLEPNPTKRYTLGAHGAWCALVLALMICLENALLRERISDMKGHLVHITLSATQLVASLLLCLTYMMLPRRPDVLRKGKIVDQQYSVSLLERYSFTWPGPLVKYAKTNKTLEISDLNELDYPTRAENLQKKFHELKPRRKLWMSVFFAHEAAFIQQYILVALVAVSQFGPQFALLKILRALEARAAGEGSNFVAWMWVLGLGGTMAISAWIEAWLFWIIFSRLGVPIYEQLSAVIFMKAMRRKDVKGTKKAKEEKPVEGNGVVANGGVAVDQGVGKKGEDAVLVPDEDDDEDPMKSKQSTINLVGVDSRRVADFSTFNYIFLMTILKLTVAFTFLIVLIGWKSLFAGLAVIILATPVNIWASKKYANAQDSLMKTRDKKMAVMTEALQGIRQIKFSALEPQWQEKIGAIRDVELKTQWSAFVLNTVLISIWILGPVMLSAVSLAVYSIINGGLSASVAFTTIAVFSGIEMTLAIIPEMTTEFLDAWVSIERIEKFLNAPEKVVNTVPADSISYEDASLAWPADEAEEEERYVLRNISIDFPNKELSVISGKTGCGKSLLLSSILGECDVLAGVIKVPKAPALADRHDDKANRDNWIIDSAVAYVAQIPWIENATIKDNILFGLPLDTQRYKKVLSACALEKDLEMHTDGELTDIGANGINLSGGQRWRVTFARALYSRAGILILDDIFSAVDAHVGRHLYEEALTGELCRGRTRILVTHHVSLTLPKTKYMVALGDGTVEHAGLVEELKKSGSLTAILQKQEEEENREKEKENEEALDIDDGGGLQEMLTNRSRRSKRRSTVTRTSEAGGEDSSKLAPKKFTEDEKRETGAVKYGIYKEYFIVTGGLWFWSIVMFMFCAYIAIVLGRSWWITVWTRSYQTEKFQALHSHFRTLLQVPFEVHSQVQDNGDLWYYLGVYVGLSLFICIWGTMRYFMIFVGSIHASKILFDKLTYAVLRAPLRWLDTVPVGRILNRFTSDFNMIDSHLANDIGFLLFCGLEVLCVVIAGLFVSPLMIIFALILLAICMNYALYYLAGAREVKRLESNAKSPVFEAFGSALTGVSTIRSFDKASTFIERIFVKIDTHARASWHLFSFNRWLGFRLSIVGAIFATIIAALIVSLRGMDASLAGFALSFALEYTEALVWALRQYSAVELDMNATERVIEYSNIETEDQTGLPVPAAWPTSGRLEIDSLVTGYAPDLPPVLKGLSFSVANNQRVGVIGRTGAGKSSLTLALFRFLEAREGTITIDGIDISKIKLHDLRSRLAIIPQDPVLFSGTVRSNLDPFNQHSDAELRDALERVHLIRSSESQSHSGAATPAPTASASGTTSPNSSPTPTKNLNIFTSLSSTIAEGGLNLSQGQRQLLCLARAIVSRPKIMVLDEATSAVDMATDALIQRSIREEFGDSTLIVIAHRLSTIADFDKILVMKEGRAVEFGSPRELWDARGEFWGMCGESGEKKVLEGVIAGDGEGVADLA